MADEGFGRNLITIFGNDAFAGMGDSPIKSVELTGDKSEIRFYFEDGRLIRLGVEGDCCSSSWIEHADIPPYVIGEKIVAIDDSAIETPEGVEEDPDEKLQVYQTRFRTAKGDIVLEYRNSSNGYYGGYLVRLAD